MKKDTMTIKRLPMIIEMNRRGFWGRTVVNDNLIVDSATSVEALKKKLRKAINEIENIEVENFDISFDLTSFFEQYTFLNISDLALRIQISPLMLRQYKSGIKFPSEKRVREIETAIRDIGKELAKVKLHKGRKAAA